MNRPHSKRFLIALLCGCAFVAVAGYLSTGTMAPYAATHPRPLILKPCNDLLNPDNPHFEATFKLLRGAPRAQWDFSVVLRRTLFPVLAYLPMRIWGFLVGGVVTSLVLQVAAFATFAVYVRRRIGDVAALTTIALLATYPGIYYWCGLPYSYAIIVPATLMATICAREIDLSAALPRACLFAFLLGVLFTGYDLLAYFAPAVAMMLLLRRRFVWLVPVAALMLLPGAVNNYLLRHVAHVDFSNENSRFYATILHAYAHPPAIGAWAHHVSGAFVSLLKVYFFSNFTFLPALLLAVLVCNALKWRRRVRLEPVERWVLLTALGLFGFINLAPPYQGWQFRGVGMARIYQPVFGVMLLYVARAMQARAAGGDDDATGSASTDAISPRHGGRRILPLAVAATSLVNASIAIGPVTLNPLAGWAYHVFYRHAPEPQLRHNLALFGRRPLGFCDESIAIQNAPPKLSKAQKERLRQQLLRKHKPIRRKPKKKKR